MEIAEAAEEAGVVDEAAPVLADEGGAEEVDRLRREAQEYLPEEIVRGKRRGIGRRRARPCLHGVRGFGGKWVCVGFGL